MQLMVLANESRQSLRLANSSKTNTQIFQPRNMRECQIIFNKTRAPLFTVLKGSQWASLRERWASLQDCNLLMTTTNADFGVCFKFEHFTRYLSFDSYRMRQFA